MSVRSSDLDLGFRTRQFATILTVALVLFASSWIARSGEIAWSTVLLSALIALFFVILALVTRIGNERFDFLLLPIGYAVAFNLTFLSSQPDMTFRIPYIVAFAMLIPGLAVQTKSYAIFPIVMCTCSLALGLLVAGFSGSAGGGDPMTQWIMNQFGWSLDSAELFIHYLRKTLHFLFYGSLGFTFAIYARRNVTALQSVCALGLIWALAHAVFDEIRQSYSVGRSGSFWDVMLDLAGALAMIGVWFWIQVRKATNTKNG